jgi:hypothetical protein
MRDAGVFTCAVQIAVIIGCTPGAGHRDTARATSKTLNDSTVRSAPTADTSGRAIISEARRLYDYGRERPPISVRDTAYKGPYVSDDSIPRVWIATASLKPNTRRPTTRIIARIRSERSFAPLGLVAGYNYVWRNSWDTTTVSRWKTRIVPDDSAARPHDLVRDARNHEYTRGMSPLEPRLVRIKVHSSALGLCLDDPICPTGHCGYYGALY